LGVSQHSEQALSIVPRQLGDLREDGTVGDVNVTRSLDTKYLDAEAVKAVKQWTFKPGMKDGKAVPVLVTIEMAFTLA
jgi:TonB family protein